MECLNGLKLYMEAESLDTKKTQLDTTSWKLECVTNIPHQTNGSDCRVLFCNKYAEYVFRQAQINFQQKDMPYFRRQMVYEILTKKLQKFPTPTEMRNTKIAIIVREMYENHRSSLKIVPEKREVKRKTKDKEANIKSEEVANKTCLKKGNTQCSESLEIARHHGVHPALSGLPVEKIKSLIKNGMKGPDFEFWFSEMSAEKKSLAKRIKRARFEFLDEESLVMDAKAKTVNRQRMNLKVVLLIMNMIPLNNSKFLKFSYFQYGCMDGDKLRILFMMHAVYLKSVSPLAQRGFVSRQPANQLNHSKISQAVVEQEMTNNPSNSRSN